MFTPLILFLGLTVATAVIAHWSDNLGKKLGKKRVSLFGLRPRTTATILTVASSWGIMLFTLAAMLIAFVPLRNALFSYDRERDQANEIRQRLVLTQAQFDVAKDRLASTQNQVNTAYTRLTQEQKKLTQANLDVKKSQTAAQQAEKQGKNRAEAAQNQASAAVARAKAAQNRVIDAQNRLAAARNGEVAARRQRISAQKGTRLARTNLRTARNQLKSTKTSLKTAQTDLATAQTSAVQAGQSAFIAGRSAFKAGQEQLRAEGRVRDIKKQLAVLKAQRRALETLAAKTAPLLESDAPIKAGQTFAAGLISADQSASAVAVQLREMLKQAREKFAENEENSPIFPPTATLQLLPLTERDANGKRKDLQGEGLLQFLARRLAGQATSVRLVAPLNYLASETQIGVIFVPMPVAPAFASGQVLASTTIDGAQGDARIFRSLLDLLDLGQREAEKRGVNPPKSPDEPHFFAEGTNVRLFEVLRRIERSKLRVSVNLVAAKSLSTVEPLQVFFEIEGDSGVPE